MEDDIQKQIEETEQEIAEAQEFKINLQQQLIDLERKIAEHKKALDMKKIQKIRKSIGG